MMRRGDKILIIIIIAAIAIGYGWKMYVGYKFRNSQSIASIEIDGKPYGSYDLKNVGSKTIKLELPDDENSVVEFSDGKVRVKEANCPDKVCVKTGWISKPGEMIVCIPYKVVIKISGEKQDVDINAY